jgi:hypothetical protein
MCVTVNCTVHSRAVSRSLINPLINPTPVYSYTHTRDNIKMDFKNRVRGYGLRSGQKIETSRKVF